MDLHETEYWNSQVNDLKLYIAKMERRVPLIIWLIFLISVAVNGYFIYRYAKRMQKPERRTSKYSGMYEPSTHYKDK